ncbi:hypothetical protein [Dictyobacter aurantiacus]|uniref:Uncharacterized protein n=1 Tax=Dictyobacter aurantiacus TaxID=1936993 RepID=A0A401ZGY2_9CHLR|nr:hypothetical protein [Dictyobacter aurantiacus]GCE06145.1 hypothetical protein KDAU_34740 [Dictyobacter aurantiacus]
MDRRPHTPPIEVTTNPQERIDMLRDQEHYDAHGLFPGYSEHYQTYPDGQHGPKGKSATEATHSSAAWLEHVDQPDQGIDPRRLNHTHNDLLPFLYRPQASGVETTPPTRSQEMSRRGKGHQKRIDITTTLPTAAHLDATRLYNRNFQGAGGMERMLQEAPDEARLFQEYNAIRYRGADWQKTAFKTLQEQQGGSSAPSINIENMQPTPEHLEATRLYDRNFRGSKGGGMERMLQEAPDEARLFQEYNAMRQRGTDEQKARLKALREQQRGGRKNRS